MSIGATGLGFQTSTNPQQTANAAATVSPSTTSGLAFSGGFATYNGQPIALSDITDDQSGKFTAAQQGQADDTLLAREKAAYGQYEGTNTQAGNKQFVVAYIAYVKSLPPDEQNSQRYRGTQASAQALLDEINAQPSTPASTDKSGVSNLPSAITILQSGETALQKALKSSKSSNTGSTDVVDLSPAAQAYLSLASNTTTPNPKSTISTK
jgi:hypothetical protein